MGTVPVVRFTGLSLLCDLLFMMYVKYQSIAYIFMLTFDKFCDCVGTHAQFVKKSSRKVWTFEKKGLPLHSLS